MTSHVHLFARVFTVCFLLLLCPISRAQDVKPRPTGSISGHILVNGKGAAGINVGAVSSDNFNRRVPAAQTKTDSEGYYHLEGLAAGNYQVMTFTPHLTPEESGSDFQSGFGPYTSAKQILLSEGENVTDIDIKLVRGGVITGRVTDADNKPVIEEHISLEVVTEPGSQRPNRISSSAGNMYQTDDRGIYRIYGLPGGRYRVSAGRNSSQGLIGQSGGYYQQTFHPDVTDRSQATVIDLVAGGEAKNVDIRLGRREDTFKIAGMIVDASTGLPIAGARVGVRINNGAITPSVNQTAPDGRFVLSGVAPGHYGLYLSSDFGSNEYYSDPVYVDLVDKDLSGVEIKALHGLTVNGSITTENIELKDLLRQIPGLRVSANVVQPNGTVSPTMIRSFGTGMIGADGSFTISGLRPGHVLLSVASSDPSRRPTVVKTTVGGVGVPQGFEIEAGQPVSDIQIVVTYGTGVIKGGVTTQGGSSSGYRIQVACRREGSNNYGGGGPVDARGHFAIRQLAPGVYDCAVAYINVTSGPTPRPTIPQHQMVNVDNGMEAELNFVIDLTPKGVGP